MTNPINIQLSADILLDPSLDVIVRELGRQRPDLTFIKTTRLKHDGGNSSTYNRDVLDNNEAPKDKKFIRCVVVLQNSRVVGQLEVFSRYRYRSGSSEDVIYRLRSDRLENGRQGHCMDSKNKAKIISAAKKYFHAFNDAEIHFDNIDKVIHAHSRALHYLQREVFDTKPFTHKEVMKMHLALQPILSDVQPVLADMLDIKLTLSDSKYQDKLSRYLLGEAMKDRQYVAVSRIGDSYVMFLEETPSDRPSASKAPIFSGAFDTLPLDMQNKIAVLQLVENDELVLDVGLKVTDDIFYVVT